MSSACLYASTGRIFKLSRISSIEQEFRRLDLYMKCFVDHAGKIAYMIFQNVEISALPPHCNFVFFIHHSARIDTIDPKAFMKSAIEFLSITNFDM